VESALISAVLEECENVQTKTATRLGINRNTLHKKMKDFGLEPSS
jgi:DNA-binding protein Fis